MSDTIDATDTTKASNEVSVDVYICGALNYIIFLYKGKYYPFDLSYHFLEEARIDTAKFLVNFSDSLITIHLPEDATFLKTLTITVE